MINIVEKKIEGIEDFIHEYHCIGGCVEFAFYEIKENYLGQKPDDEYMNHLVTASQILELINYEAGFHSNMLRFSYNNPKRTVCSNSSIPSTPTTDYSLLCGSGQKICLEEFLGPYIDIENKIPYIRGRKDNSTMNLYFKYNEEEGVDNALPMNALAQEHYERFPDCGNGFIYALLEPPYNLRVGGTLKERGEYFLRFIDLLFNDDWEKLVIYKWNTDCNPYFDAGKEWWGEYFWTVYNPIQNIYIGIVASTTD